MSFLFQSDEEYWDPGSSLVCRLLNDGIISEDCTILTLRGSMTGEETATKQIKEIKIEKKAKNFHYSEVLTCNFEEWSRGYAEVFQWWNPTCRNGASESLNPKIRCCAKCHLYKTFLYITTKLMNSAVL